MRPGRPTTPIACSKSIRPCVPSLEGARRDVTRSRSRQVVSDSDPSSACARARSRLTWCSSPLDSPRPSATTVEGASVRASLPTLRRSVGLCPRCAQPYTALPMPAPMHEGRHDPRRCQHGDQSDERAGITASDRRHGRGPKAPIESRWIDIDLQFHRPPKLDAGAGVG